MTNPLATLTDIQLWNTQVLLGMSCARHKSVLQKTKRQYFCALQKNFKVEADLRGLPSPPQSSGVGALKHDPDSI